MIENILTLLEVAKQYDVKGDYIKEALGKHKLPMSFKEVKNNLKLKK
tara:strand:- start:460 stop:600 length:141 start_codon:yes stop_codon:yes gene_type:complete